MNVKTAKINLSIDTNDRGDLQIMLVSPGGCSIVLHNEEGAGKDNFIPRDFDISSSFTGARAEGKWALRVRDRLKDDIAKLNSFRLEVTATERNGSTPP